MRAAELYVLELRWDAADDGRAEGCLHEELERRTFCLLTPRRSRG